MTLPEWLLPYLPAITTLLGLAISWALASDAKLVAWFQGLKGWGKLGVLAGICLLYGALQVFGFGAELVDGVFAVLEMFLGMQVGYVTKPSS